MCSTSCTPSTMPRRRTPHFAEQWPTTPPPCQWVSTTKGSSPTQ
jgi:hypothetical protein